MSVGLGLAFCVFFWFTLDYFVPVLFAFVLLGLDSSALCQEIGHENVFAITCVVSSGT